MSPIYFMIPLNCIESVLSELLQLSVSCFLINSNAYDKMWWHRQALWIEECVWQCCFLCKTITIEMGKEICAAPKRIERCCNQIWTWLCRTNISSRHDRCDEIFRVWSRLTSTVLISHKKRSFIAHLQLTYRLNGVHKIHVTANIYRIYLKYYLMFISQWALSQ